MSGNTRRGVSVNKTHELAVYDALPPFFKFVFQNLAMNFAVSHATARCRHMRRDLGEAAAKRQWLADLDDSITDETYATYGPDHPDSPKLANPPPPAPYATWRHA